MLLEFWSLFLPAEYRHAVQFDEVAGSGEEKIRVVSSTPG